MTPQDNEAALRLIGEGLAPGRRARANHSCGPGRTMIVSRDADRTTAWCFRCNSGPPPVHHRLSMQDNIMRVFNPGVAAAEAEATASCDPPDDYNPCMGDWPVSARVWLARYGFSTGALPIEAGWSESLQRLVLLVRDGDAAMTWTARAVDARKPKYLTGPLPENAVANAIPSRRIWAPPVVTEDWVSAVKVAAAGRHAYSLLGTYAKPATLLRLFRAQEVIVWLDPDEAGQTKAAQLCATLRAYGGTPRNVLSLRDPKLHSLQEIREYARAAAGITT